MSDVPTQPEPGPGYWPAEWQRHIERAERDLAENPRPAFPVVEQPEQQQVESAPATFDPGEHTVAEVEDYVVEHIDERQAVLDAELAGKNRVTLVDWLQAD